MEIWLGAHPAIRAAENKRPEQRKTRPAVKRRCLVSMVIASPFYIHLCNGYTTVYETVYKRIVVFIDIVAEAKMRFKKGKFTFV